MKQELEKKFPGQLEFESTATPNATGYFEVEIADSGTVLHSKKVLIQLTEHDPCMCMLHILLDTADPG